MKVRHENNFIVLPPVSTTSHVKISWLIHVFGNTLKRVKAWKRNKSTHQKMLLKGRGGKQNTPKNIQISKMMTYIRC